MCIYIYFTTMNTLYFLKDDASVYTICLHVVFSVEGRPLIESIFIFNHMYSTVCLVS